MEFTFIFGVPCRLKKTACSCCSFHEVEPTFLKPDRSFPGLHKGKRIPANRAKGQFPTQQRGELQSSPSVHPPPSRSRAVPGIPSSTPPCSTWGPGPRAKATFSPSPSPQGRARVSPQTLTEPRTVWSYNWIHSGNSFEVLHFCFSLKFSLSLTSAPTVNTSTTYTDALWTLEMEALGQRTTSSCFAAWDDFSRVYVD